MQTQRRLRYNPFLLLLLVLPLLWFSFSHSYAEQVTLAWDAPIGGGDVEGYKLYSSDIQGVYDYDLPLWIGTETQVTVIIEPPEWFIVRAFNEYGDSGNSNEILYSEISPATNIQITWEEIENPVAWAYVNAGIGTSGDSTTPGGSIATGAFAVTAGNGLVVGIACYNAGAARTVSQVQDTAGNTYTYRGRVQNNPPNDTLIEIWSAQNITGHASNVITATFSNTCIYRRIIALQFSGVSKTAFFDSGYTPAGNTDASTPYTTTAANTAGNNEFIVGFFYNADMGFTYSSSSPSVYRTETGDGDFAAATNNAASQGSWSVSVAASASENHGCFARAFLEATGYEIQASPGAYTLSGQAATLTKASKLSAAAGSYAITGQAATLTKASKLSAAAGSYAITGQAATLTKTGGYSLLCEAGSILITGTSASLIKHSKIPAAPGSYAITGQAATLTKGYSLLCEAGSILITGTSASLIKHSKISAAPGSFILTGYDATLTKETPGYILTAESGVFIISGQSAVLRYKGVIAISLPTILWPRIPDFLPNDTEENFKRLNTFLIDLRRTLDNRDTETKKYIHQHS